MLSAAHVQEVALGGRACSKIKDFPACKPRILISPAASLSALFIPFSEEKHGGAGRNRCCCMARCYNKCNIVVAMTTNFHSKLAPIRPAVHGWRREGARASSLRSKIDILGGWIVWRKRKHVHSVPTRCFIYCALASLSWASDCTRLPVSLFFCLSRGVERLRDNWPLCSQISNSDQSLANVEMEMRAQPYISALAVASRIMGSLAITIYTCRSAAVLLLFWNVSLPIVKLKCLANKINGL